MGKKKPKAPDPHATAQAQAGMNRDTAITQQYLNMVNQFGPWGSVVYDQHGTAPDGTPLFSQTTELSPGQQALFESGVNAQQGLVDYANRLTQTLGESGPLRIDPDSLPELHSGFGAAFNPYFNQQLDLATSYAGAEDFSADRQRYEDALWERTAGDRSAQEASLRTQLANKGIREGSAAWNAEMERLQRQNTDARLATLLAGGEEQQRMVGMARDAAIFGNQALTGMGQFGMAAQQAQNAAAAQQAGFSNTARQQALQEQIALHNQPLNEITAMLGLGAVGTPANAYGATPQTGVAGVDYAGLVNQNYQQQMANYQNQMGGLFGLGSSIIGAAGAAGGFGSLFSDVRLKTDIKRVGTTDGGTPIYTYRYITGGPVHMGVMAQDVPGAAVETESGYLAVDYSKVV